MKKNPKHERLILLKLIIGVVLIVVFIINSCLLMGAYWSNYQTRKKKSLTITSPVTSPTFTLQNTDNSDHIINPNSQQIVDMITMLRLIRCNSNQTDIPIKSRCVSEKFPRPTGTLLFKADTEYDVNDLIDKKYYASEKETSRDWGAFIFYRDLHPWIKFPNCSGGLFDDEFLTAKCSFRLRRYGESWQDWDKAKLYRKICFKETNGFWGNRNREIMVNYFGGRYHKIQFNCDIYDSKHEEWTEVYQESIVRTEIHNCFYHKDTGEIIQKVIIFDKNDPKNNTTVNAYFLNDQKNYVCFYKDINHQEKICEIYFNTTNPMLSPIAKIIQYTNWDE